MSSLKTQVWATALLVVSFVIAFIFQNNHTELLYRLSDAFFISGMLQLAIALCMIVKKLGFFKSLKYAAYKTAHMDDTRKPIPFHEYVHENQHKPKKNEVPLFLVYGLIPLAISLIFSIL